MAVRAVCVAIAATEQEKALKELTNQARLMVMRAFELGTPVASVLTKPWAEVVVPPLAEL